MASSSVNLPIGQRAMASSFVNLPTGQRAMASSSVNLPPHATTMASSSIDHNVLKQLEGVVPRVSKHFAESHRLNWLKAVLFETTFYDQQPSPLKPAQMHTSVRQARSHFLRPYGGTDVHTHYFEWTAAKVDRLIYSGQLTGRLDLVMRDLVDDVVAEERVVDMMLGAFGQCDPVTPSRWYTWLLHLMPPFRRARVSQVIVNCAFQLVAWDGAVADVKPSKVAAAMLLALHGDQQAAPYLCGYEPAELYGLRDYIFSHLNTLTPFCVPPVQQRADHQG